MKLLTPAHANAKTAKNAQFNQYLTSILHLAPATLSGYNVCPKASQGCAASCLNTAGRGRFDSIQLARLNKTKRFFEDKTNFINDLIKDIAALERKAKRELKKPVVRLNGTSDIQWERLKVVLGKTIFELFPNVQFYDYTKIFTRLLSDLPANYHLTFSASESNETECLEALALGYNVAMVFDSMPSTYKGFNVVSGDDHDLRFLDAPNSIIGLSAKGKAKKDTSGFVREGL